MNKKLKLVLATAIVTVFSFQGAQALSLKLKKEQKSTQEKIDTKLAEINQKCGCAPTVEINWESFEKKEDFFIASRNVNNIGDGMAAVCKDFKKEVCEGVKTVKITKGDPMSKSLKAGVIEETIPSGDRTWGASDIQKLIEENL